MSKKIKRLKITEEMMNEIINSDGGLIGGGFVEYPNNSVVKTTTYDNKKDGMAWHTDNQRWSANQDGKFYYYFRGYGYSSGSVSESYIVEDDLHEEDIVSKFNNSEILNKGNVIPDFEELYKSYDATDLADNTEDLVQSVNSFSESDNFEDLVAIITKKVIKDLNTKQLNPNQRKELKDSI